MEEKPISNPSSSSSPPLPKKYDVFLSFRGEDTRFNFTSHLYAALCQKGIFYTFKDDDELKKGKDIGPELMKAIEDSNYAVIILSENYATSSWCLKELTKIVECMGNSGRIRTIFYHVDPSHVRNVKSTEVEKQQKSSFWKALKKHAENPSHSKDLISSWKNALETVANKAGDPVNSVTKKDGDPVQANTDEAKFIQDFITKLSTDLGASIKSLEGFVGMTPRLRQLDSHVLKSKSDVRFIGIHGMGGIGKSTLATAYYKRMSHEFEGSSFLRNVKEVCEKKENGLVHLQNQLLADILKGAFPKIGDVGSGIDMIRSRLRRKKVLIVLDDVSKLEQLEALADSHKRKNGSDHDQLDTWFGSGSIIIVTTRNEGLLSQRYKIYRAEHLNPKEALELFSSKAFESNEPPQAYKELSKKVVEYAEYLPLALNVLGSLLSSKKDINAWEGALSRLENCPAKEIVEKLEISYDDLEETDQRIFLDIACFFKGHDKDYVIPILDSCGFNSEYGISNLIERSLLEIQHGRKLWMRDLLQKMGHNIVRRESKRGGPSRLWDVNEFKSILGKTKGMENVEAIVVNFEKKSRMSRFGALSNMEKLRLLMILGSFEFQAESGSSTPKFDSLSNELHLLEWNRYPFKEFPSCFEPYKLVELKLTESNLQRLWNNSIEFELPSLKVIDLRDSRYFSTFEDFGVVPNLEKLILEGCTKLLEIHSSITSLGMLTILNLKNCTSLEKLPPSIKGLDSLQNLNLNGCRKLRELPEDIGHLQSLKEIDVRESGIKHLPSSIKSIKNLETLISEEIVNLTENSGFSKLWSDVFCYDVFLCFRGEDTRHGFTSYLRDALIRQGYKIFSDYDMGKGKPIELEILRGIEHSRCSIVVLSENYASSSWCLIELAKIVDCMKSTGQIVLPIFYHVDPSHVRKQRGRYGEDFDRYLSLNFEHLEHWRDSLRTVGSLAGWSLQETDIDAHFIQDFIEDISQKLPPSKKIDQSGKENLETLQISEEIVNISKDPVMVVPSIMGYDVFLSFRGEDTFNGFTGFLCQALSREGYRIFFHDHYEQDRRSNSPELMKAIEDSRCSIVVFSESYAVSIRCLTELAKIAECMNSMGQIVLPIFYHVEPSDVRNQRGIYGDAFKMIEANPSRKYEEVESWRFALKEICGLFGWKLHGSNELNVIEEVVTEISNKLDGGLKKISKGDSPVEKSVMNPTIGKASFSRHPNSSEMLDPSDDNLSNESFPNKDSETTAFTSLRKHFQDPYGATKSFDIVIPGSKIPPWFTQQCSGGSISIKLNPNWCNSNWMGLALAVCFHANPSNVLYCDMKLDNNDWKVRSMDYDYATMANSDQIWLFYYPRHKWPAKELLNSYFNLDVSFHSKVPFRDNFGPCGVRLVFKKDIEELGKFNSNYFNESPNRKDQFQHGQKRDSTDGGHFKEHMRFRRRSF